MDLRQLHAPFPPDDIDWRLQTSGKKGENFWAMALAYVTARAVQDRLDDVCGPENWRNEYREAPAGGVLCGISVRVDGEWVTKWDGAENTDVEAIKGGLSGAMKRAAVQWGIGRYLYHLSEGWATCYPNEKTGKFRGATKDKERFSWDPPALPAWALPGGDGKPPHVTVDRKTGEEREAAKPAEQPATNGAKPFVCPRCAGAVFDNREDKAAGKKGARMPDLKCRDTKCGWVVWMGSWRDDVLERVKGAEERGAIDKATAETMRLKAAELEPPLLVRISKAVDDANAALSKRMETAGDRTDGDLFDAEADAIHAAYDS